MKVYVFIYLSSILPPPILWSIYHTSDLYLDTKRSKKGSEIFVGGTVSFSLIHSHSFLSVLSYSNPPPPSSLLFLPPFYSSHPLPFLIFTTPFLLSYDKFLILAPVSFVILKSYFWDPPPVFITFFL